MKKIDLSFLHTFSDRFFGSNEIVHPRKDWIILLVVFFVMLASAAIYDLSIHQDIASGEMYVSVNKSDLKLQSIDAKALENVVVSFESKKSRMATLKIQKLIDPSL